MRRPVAFRQLFTLIALGALVAAPENGLRAYAFVNPANASVASEIRSYSPRPSPQALKWANKELGRMSLDEKIGQLICVAVNATFLNQDSEAFKALRHQVA